MNTIDAKERAAGLRQIAHHLHPTEREELEEVAKFLDHYNALVEALRYNLDTLNGLRDEKVMMPKWMQIHVSESLSLTTKALALAEGKEPAP
jgi:hypothetical protein